MKASKLLSFVLAIGLGVGGLADCIASSLPKKFEKFNNYKNNASAVKPREGYGVYQFDKQLYHSKEYVNKETGNVMELYLLSDKPLIYLFDEDKNGKYEGGEALLDEKEDGINENEILIDLF